MASARIHATTPQAIPCGRDTAITFDAVRWDDGGFTDPGFPTRFIVPTTDTYIVGGCVAVKQGAYQTQLVFHVNGNGSAEIASHDIQLGTAPYNLILTCNTVWRFTEGDYVEMIFYHLNPLGLSLIVEDPLCPEFWISHL